MPFLLFFSSINLMDSSPTSKPKEETARKEGTGKNRLKNLSKKLKDIIGLYQIRFLLSKYLCSISAGRAGVSAAAFYLFYLAVRLRRTHHNFSGFAAWRTPCFN